MALLRRTFTSLSAKIDQWLGDIENHDALIQAVIGEQKKKIGAARFQLKRIQDSETRLNDQIAELKCNQRRWLKRATKTAREDETKALACLQRRRTIRSQLTKLNAMLQEYRQSAERMDANIRQCEEDLANMIQKHQMLQARQSTAEAMQIMDCRGSLDLEDVAASFERWEVKIAQSEYRLDGIEQVDELENEFLSAEEQSELRAELAELLNQSNPEEL